MRIRTVKPEFWTHPIMSRLPYDSRLLAIALLNLADDHGYFEADTDYIRGAVLFREQSKNVLRMIQELSCAGWIELSGSAERPIGRVANFSKHQRVDKPQTSKLQQYWDSKNDLGTILEESKNDPRGNREQGKEQGKEHKRAGAMAVEEVELPDELQTPSFREAWADWLEDRKDRREPVTPLAAKLQLKKLSKLPVGQAIQTIQTSIEKGWKGLFPETKDPSKPNSPTAPRGHLPVDTRTNEDMMKEVF
jgi:hypothetical protein